MFTIIVIKIFVNGEEVLYLDCATDNPLKSVFSSPIKSVVRVLYSLVVRMLRSCHNFDALRMRLVKNEVTQI
jgi:hypothetical protein